jgi:hypothetical protein
VRLDLSPVACEPSRLELKKLLAIAAKRPESGRGRDGGEAKAYAVGGRRELLVRRGIWRLLLKDWESFPELLLPEGCQECAGVRTQTVERHASDDLHDRR